MRPAHLRLNGNYTRGNLGEMLCLPPREVQPYELRYDRYGFRNDTDLVKADIAVIGDSYVESPYAPAEALVTTVLSRHQPGHGREPRHLGIWSSARAGDAGAVRYTVGAKDHHLGLF